MVKVRENLTGQQFGRLRVLYQTEDYVKPSGIHCAMYRCICDCQEHNEINVCANDLKSGHTKSCGCLRNEKVVERNKKYNEYKIENNIVYIKLSNCDECTMINLDKWNEIPYIKEFCWHKHNHGYAYTRIPNQYRQYFNKANLFLHNLICPCKDGYEPDHLDRNKLNNLTNNLIPKTHQGNNLNKGLQSNNKSGYTGVCWDKTKNKWKAQICVNGNKMCLGNFDSIDGARQAYQNAKIQYFKELI